MKGSTILIIAIVALVLIGLGLTFYYVTKQKTELAKFQLEEEKQKGILDSKFGAQLLTTLML